MNAERDRNLDHAVGRLEAGQEHLEGKLDEIINTLRDHAGEASSYRQAMRDKIAGIDRKIDPVAIRVDALDMTVKAHEVVLKSYAQRDDQLALFGRIGKWVFHAAWLTALGLGATWNEHLRPLLTFWKW